MTEPARKVRAREQEKGDAGVAPGSKPAAMLVQTAPAAPTTVRTGTGGKAQEKEQATIITGGDTMPGFDNTGPAGGGPMTGSGLGTCGNARVSGQTLDSGGAGYGNQYGFGRRGNRGFGMGRGRRAGFVAGQRDPQEPMAAGGEIEALKMQVEKLQQSLDTLLQKTDNNNG